jgi:hypothetical protein
VLYDQLTTWSEIGAILAGAGVIFAAGRWVWRRHQWASPLSATYLIPRSHYRAVDFAGAPQDEESPKSLSMGVGHYKLLFRMEPHQPNLVVKGIQIAFEGAPNDARPIDDGLTTLDSGGLFESSLGRLAYRDREGQLRLRDNVDRFPKHFGLNDRWDIANLVRTSGAWTGCARVTIMWRSESGGETGRYEVELPLAVVADPSNDEIPFLKVD